MGNDIIMPFGKYRGSHLDTIPRGYLRWVAANVPLNDWLKMAIHSAIQGMPIPAPPPIIDIDEEVHRIVKEYVPAEKP